MTRSTEWRDVPGYSGLYEVSDAGAVRSLRPYRGQSGPRLLIPSHPTGGYATVALCLGGICRRRRVHQLVAEVFIGSKPEWADCVRHLNGDSRDNQATNLAYGTNSQNVQDAIRHGAHHWAKQTTCPNGHPYDAENTALNVNGTRRCRECSRGSSRKKAARIKAERLARGPLSRKLKTHCSQGHEFTPDNVRLSRSKPGVRICKTCQHEYEAGRWARAQAGVR